MSLDLSEYSHAFCLLFCGIRWLGFQSSFLVRAPHGPAGPHPRGKIPEGKLERDFASPESELAANSFFLLFFAAIGHSSWNLLDKRAAHRKHLAWLSSLGASIVLLPVFLWILNASHWALRLRDAACLLATGILHLLYTESLLRGYRVGDLSVVYPLARRIGPLFTFCAVMLAFGERPSGVALSPHSSFLAAFSFSLGTC